MVGLFHFNLNPSPLHFANIHLTIFGRRPQDQHNHPVIVHLPWQLLQKPHCFNWLDSNEAKADQSKGKKQQGGKEAASAFLVARPS
jgi:hypothetical protein